MSEHLTPKQDRFARNLFLGSSQREAWIEAGYSSKYPVSVIDSNACRLAATSKIKARFEELQTEADNEAIAPVKERMKRLSEILRARVADFRDAAGNPDVTSEKNVSPCSRMLMVHPPVEGCRRKWYDCS